MMNNQCLEVMYIDLPNIEATITNGMWQSTIQNDSKKEGQHIWHLSKLSSLKMITLQLFILHGIA